MQHIHAYTIKRNMRSRSIKLHIDSKGELTVTSSPFVPEFLIKKFVEQSEVWIVRNMGKINRLKQNSDVKNVLFYFGQQYAVSIEHNSIGTGVEIHETEIIVRPVLQTQESIQKQLVRWYKSAAESHMTDRIHALSQLMKTEFTSIIFRDQKTRWGSCSSTGTLSFNWKLIQAPKEVIDYVIIHELSHTKHMNHSPSFWRCVEHYDGNYKEHRQWLRKNAVLLHSTILS